MCRSSESADNPCDPINNADFLYHEISAGNFQAYATYCAYFYNPTYKVIARFSGVKDIAVLCELTETVFFHLWENREQFMQVSIRGGLLYRTTMQIILFYLKECGNYERIRQIKEAINTECIFREIEKNDNDGQKK